MTHSCQHASVGLRETDSAIFISVLCFSCTSLSIRHGKGVRSFKIIFQNELRKLDKITIYLVEIIGLFFHSCLQRHGVIGIIIITMGTSLMVVYNSSFSNSSWYRSDAAGPPMVKLKKPQRKPPRPLASIREGYTGVIDKKVSSALTSKVHCYKCKTFMGKIKSIHRL